MFPGLRRGRESGSSLESAFFLGGDKALKLCGDNHIAPNILRATDLYGWVNYLLRKGIISQLSVKTSTKG
jgi:hypothetical protein